ncbi:uncharacterized protein N0V89_003043 [Didymosphaeria variabile]|uniref:Uncharacterized protein n=1 Tax=Didymosphaeria variabile TaxID=1932322 RepID=A0A9W9CF00_9PLEO|nr:uncharacterized protein N0V89_003043 [Didymosphaeria variabile]KAJ4358460.1 hypothetical protein N0V89_003043 [Didymosphaeria variabile]
MLGIVTDLESIRAIPAAVPEAQFGIGPPHYSISWDAPLPVTTDDPEDPEDPEEPEYPAPTPSDEISLGQPSATVSWDGPSVPTEAPEPEDPEDPEDPQPSPTNIISLHPPSYSISWDGPKPPKTTKKPWPPRPTAKTSTKGFVSASVSWNKRQDSPSYSITWDLRPPKTTSTPSWWPWWPPAYTSTHGYVSASVSWGKRQEDEDPEPTDFPDFPEDPEETENPISFPAPPVFTPPNSIGIQPPQVSFSWGKREEAATAPSYGLGKPTASVRVPKPPKTTTKAWISWGKRQEGDDPTEVFPPAPTPSDQITLVKPTPSISWGKRGAEAQLPTYGLGFPTFSFGLPPVAPSSAYISWGKRDDDKHHTTFVTQTPPTLTSTEYIPSSVPSACPTVTKTIVPPCVPPTCPDNLVSCKVGAAQAVEAREIEKTIVTLTTVAKPSWKHTATESGNPYGMSYE